ncbi:hypothetical protein Micbo1qcDRAFT_205667 [Microdochium bolleyi]|uniref:F-box domain-containing protein n=1 Tax=Microdochium bolleyi TaxID=196109 RepID=A0A136IYI8_9PEZI|nr:hypothetical protein Micbo1qcDRAFT_205667 [Microdochium bolleyi]
MANPQPSAFLTRIPLDIRLRIYAMYMVQHTRAATRSIAPAQGHFPKLSRPPYVRRLVGFESAAQDGPPLMRACRQIATELKPLSGQHLRYVICCSESSDPDLQEEPVFSLPARCAAVATVRHLEIEWRLDNYPFFVHASQMDIIEQLQIIVPGSEVDLARHITTLRIELVSQAGPDKPNVYMVVVEAVLEHLFGCCTLLRHVEVIGLVRKEWMERLEARMGDRVHFLWGPSFDTPTWHVDARGSVEG